MAGLERDHLLQGLETLSKPPTPRWVKVLRAVSAAAMLALIISAGLIIVHFAGTPKPFVPTGPALPATTQLADAEKQKTAPLREFSSSLRDRENQFVADQSDNTLENDELPSPHETKHPFFAKSSVSADAAKKKEGVGVLSSESFADKVQSSRMKAPLSLRPSPVHFDESAGAGVAGRNLGDLAWPVELVYELSSSDLPGWMLLKEQVIIALMENHIPVLSESYQVADDLKNNDEFFYLAKKGLDLPPGSRSAQILLVTQPEKFSKIHASLQQAMTDTTRQTLSPDLENYLRSRLVTASLAGHVQSSFASLDRIFGITTLHIGPLTTQTTLSTQPTTAPATQATSQAISIVPLCTASAPTSLPSTSPTTMTTTTTPQPLTTIPTTLESCRASIDRLAVLIKIDIGKPVTTTTSAPSTSSAPASQPVE
jgi:hypothetical protein